LESARAPARLELIQQRPFVILDTAHNAASMAATVQGLRDYWPTQRLVFVVATTRGKDVAAILRHILSVADTVILTKYLSNPRGHSIDDLQHALRRVLVNEPFPGRILPIPDPREALRAAYLEAGVDDVICVTGSFFLATDLMPVLSDQPTPPEVEGT
jgi:dihydrofolate synthase/folylpolyglutamate synthase